MTIRHASRLALAVTVSIVLPVSVAAQTDDPAQIRALAAGYEAAFTCSATFNADRSPQQVEANELTAIYPEYRGDAAALKAEVHADEKYVAVPFAENMAPRIAVWRENLGCTQLPIGAAYGDMALPHLPLSATMAKPERPAPLPRAEDAALSALVSAAFDSRSYGPGSKTSAVMIVKDGKVVGERYAHGISATTPQRTWSVAKSIAGTMLGVAAGKGLIDLSAPAPIPEWQAPGDPRSKITTEQLMRMASGLTSDFAGNRTDAIYVGGTSVADSAPGLPLLHAPGSHFRYANNDILLAAYALHNAMWESGDYLALPYRELLWPIGMVDTYLETDWRGDFVMSSQVWTSSEDLARLGQLYLNDGVKDGARILPEGFVDFVSSRSGPQPEGRDWGYGATFWVAPPELGLPEGTFAAMGNRGQYLVIVPSLDLLVIRRGYDPIGEDKNFDVTSFARDVIAAVGQ